MLDGSEKQKEPDSFLYFLSAVHQRSAKRSPPDSQLSSNAGSLIAPSSSVDHEKTAIQALKKARTEELPLSHEQLQFNYFIWRINEQQKKMAITDVPDQLERYIKFDDLNKIFSYILKNQDYIFKQLSTSVTHSWRLDKHFTGLPRTITIVQDLNGSYYLELETKRKLSSKKKDPSIPVFKGGAKSGKPCWRLDSQSPEEWINMVVCASTYQGLQKAVKEAKTSQQLVKEAIKESSSQTLPLNYSLLGAPYKKNGKTTSTTIWAQSLYSPRAQVGTLHSLWSQNITLTKKDILQLATCLLRGIKIMHDQNRVHQDIKPANVLIYRLEDGQFLLKLNDYGNTAPNASKATDVLATIGYESPEISLVYSDKNKANHDYFFNSKYYSYGREISQELGQKRVDWSTQNPAFKHYDKPHKSNDMWAAGMVLCAIVNGKEATQKEDILQAMKIFPMIEGLLAPHRAGRLTIDKALAQWEELQSEHVTKTPAVKLPPRKKQRMS